MAGAARAEALARALSDDYRQADLPPVERAMVDFAVKLTLTPGRMHAADVDRLRALGLDDATIHDLVQVTALFNYFTRLAEGLGVEPEPEWNVPGR